MLATDSDIMEVAHAGRWNAALVDDRNADFERYSCHNWSVSVKLHLTDERTDGRTKEQTPGIEFGALKCESGGHNFNDFPDAQENQISCIID